MWTTFLRFSLQLPGQEDADGFEVHREVRQPARASRAMPGLSAEVSREFEQTCQQMHVELTAQSSNGKRIVAEKSGHYIQLDQPELVIDVIREVVEAARTGEG